MQALGWWYWLFTRLNAGSEKSIHWQLASTANFKEMSNLFHTLLQCDCWSKQQPGVRSRRPPIYCSNLNSWFAFCSLIMWLMLSIISSQWEDKCQNLKKCIRGVGWCNDRTSSLILMSVRTTCCSHETSKQMCFRHGLAFSLWSASCNRIYGGTYAAFNRQTLLDSTLARKLKNNSG